MKAKNIIAISLTLSFFGCQVGKGPPNIYLMPVQSNQAIGNSSNNTSVPIITDANTVPTNNISSVYKVADFSIESHDKYGITTIKRDNSDEILIYPSNSNETQSIRPAAMMYLM